ncbi:MAG: NnrU family protein [Pseudomonadota bacterium]
MGFAILIIGLALWWVSHLAKPMNLGFRTALLEKGGEGAAKGVGLLATLAAVALMTIGYQQAAFVNIWFPPAFMVHLNNLLMVIAVVVFFAGGVPGHVRSWIRHPQLIGFKTWATAHLLVNGDLASIILFGGLLAWGVVAMIAINKRDGKGPKPEPKGLKWDGAHAAASIVAFLVITGLHNWLGVYPFAGGGI